MSVQAPAPPLPSVHPLIPSSTHFPGTACPDARFEGAASNKVTIRNCVVHAVAERPFDSAVFDQVKILDSRVISSFSKVVALGSITSLTIRGCRFESHILGINFEPLIVVTSANIVRTLCWR